MPITTPFAAARKESFCAISSPPISARWIGTILPGYGAPKATRFSDCAVLRNTVMKSDSPVSSRLPALMSEPMNPLCAFRTISEDGFHLDAVFHVHHSAGLGDGGLHRVQFHLHELHIVTVNLVLNLVHLGHACVLSSVAARTSTDPTAHSTVERLRSLAARDGRPAAGARNPDLMLSASRCLLVDTLPHSPHSALAHVELTAPKFNRVPVDEGEAQIG